MLCTFENDGDLFKVYQNGNFLPGKNISRREKKNQEKWLCPLRKISLLPPLVPLINQPILRGKVWFLRLPRAYNLTMTQIKKAVNTTNSKILVICLVKSTVSQNWYTCQKCFKNEWKQRRLQFPCNHRTRNNSACVMMVLHQKKHNISSNMRWALQKKICLWHMKFSCFRLYSLIMPLAFNQSDDRNI